MVRKKLMDKEELIEYSHAQLDYLYYFNYEDLRN